VCWSAQAATVLVEQYKRLRADDAAPGSATAYRITVRQLEALVRLSEALARVHCSETILPSYVREVRAGTEISEKACLMSSRQTLPAATSRLAESIVAKSVNCDRCSAGDIDTGLSVRFLVLLCTVASFRLCSCPPSNDMPRGPVCRRRRVW